MDIQALKAELVKQILATESKELLDRMRHVLEREQKDFWLELTDAQKREIEKGLEQIESGQTEDWDDFMKGMA